MQYDAIILAGGESSGELKKIAPYDNEALIIIGKYPMIYYVYKALRQSSHIRNIVISGPVESLRNIFCGEDHVYFTEGGSNAVESFVNAVNFLQDKDPSHSVLIMPTDIPFITPEAIDDFIDQSENYEADFFYAVTSQEVNDKKFPGVNRTYVKLKDGVFTGGNLFMLRTRVIDQVIDMAAELVLRRKNPLAMARLFGFSLVWQYFIKRLSIQAVEKRFYKVMNIKGKAIISHYAEVGVDVDKPSDLELAHRYLADITF